MKKEELVALVKELSELESLTERSADVAFIKRECVRLNKLDDVTFKEKELIDEFNKYYDILAQKAESLNTSSLDEKKALIEKAKILLDTKNFKKATEEMNAIFEQFKHAGRCSKEQDDELWSEFRAIKNEFYDKRKAYYQEMDAKKSGAKETKLAIIEEAKKLLEEKNFKNANIKMTELLERWKKAGFAAKEDNDALWESFRTIRNEFFDNRRAYNAEVKKSYAGRIEAKQELIKKAHIALANSTFTKEEVASVKQLREDWKKVGFAGKDKDDALWEEFHSVVNKYFDELKSYSK